MVAETELRPPPAQPAGLPLTIKIACAVLVAIAGVALLAPVIAPYGYAEQDLLNRLAPPVFLENHHHKADIVTMERGASCADVRTEELD